MKRFLLKMALFFVLVAIIDVLCGWSFDWLRNKARGGQTLKSQYISGQCVDDILILGSSKAAHHYISQILSDSLGMSCYNCGQEGNGIVAAYARYKMVSARKLPKLIIYEVTPGYDYLKDNGYSGYLGALRQYTNNEDVRNEYLAFSDELEKLRLFSNMYCNNSKIVPYVKDIVRATPNIFGYEPLYGKISASGKKNSILNSQDHTLQLDSLKYTYMERLVNETKEKDIELLFIISPAFNPNENMTSYKPVFDLSEQYGIPVINNLECNTITGNNEMFQDLTHLNNTGAVEYSKLVAHQLKQFIN